MNCSLRGDYDSSTALRLAHFRRKAIPGVYSIINLSYYILRCNSSLASYLSKSLIFLSIFVTCLGSSQSLSIHFTAIFLLILCFLGNSIRYTNRNTRKVLIMFYNNFSILLYL